MDTKAKILQAALKLFNEQGADVSTVRHIAKEVGISHGNLCYHFPNTDIIINHLYDQLVDQLSVRIGAVYATADQEMEVLIESAKASMAILHDYRFLMLDFAGIMRRIPELREKHRALVVKRKVVFRQILLQLRASDRMRGELYPGHDDDLLDQLFIVGDFWLSSATIFHDGPIDEKLNHYQRIFLALLIPLLTEKGIAEWRSIEQFA
ncbi:TetR/AcrR family transcriptional regulator [Spirosoma aureum]|uniref:TetR/AcrR family transcriptional regulator n=1 Tax=Spirosoma aureum TaxID=2692134 RepID=A0A6G9AK67_9BACT|nr:TetR/AcrR family transcriptional regulator [Spirosoma aureum]QIP12862.1 TetR/AcrR family transcriptional regulator [Spirosoma aureum]